MLNQQGGIFLQDILDSYDKQLHQGSTYTYNTNAPIISSSNNLPLFPEKSSYSAYRSKYNLVSAGENSLTSLKNLPTKATGTIGSHFYDGAQVDIIDPVQVEKELSNCLFNLKKQMRRNKAKAQGFQVIEKEFDHLKIDNSLYDQVIFDDIYDKPNSNYRRVFVAPHLNQQENIPNFTGDYLGIDNQIDDFKSIIKKSDKDIEQSSKKSRLLRNLNNKINEQQADDEQRERDQVFFEEKNNKQDGNHGGILRKKNQQKNKKTLKFDDSMIYNDEEEFQENNERPHSTQIVNGKVNMSFDDFINQQNSKYAERNEEEITPQDQELELFDPYQMNQKLPRWKLQSMAMRAVMKNNPQQTREESQQIIAGLSKDDLIYCPRCKRKYKPSVAETHIPKCNEKYEERERQLKGSSKKKKAPVVSYEKLRN